MKGRFIMRANRPFWILGNWKMYLNLEGAALLAKRVAQSPHDAETVEVGLCPTFVHLHVVEKAIDGSGVMLGAQDCHEKKEGAFTGNVSAAMLKDAGCVFTIVGHSERRTFQHETDLIVRAKAIAAIDAGLHAVVCVGETLEQRESGIYLKVIESQIRNALPEPCDGKSLTVSYEPLWAIGTGKNASAEDIQEVHSHIQSLLRAKNPDAVIPRVLYGGSVKPNNALEILSLPVVDGVLVGGASLDAEAFAAIIHTATTLARKR